MATPQQLESARSTLSKERYLGKEGTRAGNPRQLVAMPRFGARVGIGGKPFDAVIIIREMRPGRFDRDRGARLVRRGEKVEIPQVRAPEPGAGSGAEVPGQGTANAPVTLALARPALPRRTSGSEALPQQVQRRRGFVGADFATEVLREFELPMTHHRRRTLDALASCRAAYSEGTEKRAT